MCLLSCRSLVVGETKGKEAVSTPDHRTERQPQCRGEARDHKRHVFNISPYQEVNLKFLRNYRPGKIKNQKCL
jgi:hypothetical protein